MPTLKVFTSLLAFTLLFSCSAPVEQNAEIVDSKTGEPKKPSEKPKGMVWIPGGTFTMGAAQQGLYKREYPAHDVEVDGFWMDEHEVTNQQFMDFVTETDYLTVAERPVDWEELKQQVPPGTEKPHDSLLMPGSLVFEASDHPVNLDYPSNWWQWKNGADWKHPEGPGSSIANRMDHPVVHIAYEDALAYCKWAGKRLATEAEWEFAARGGLNNKLYTWGNDEPKNRADLANIWHGDFPYNNITTDNYVGTAPVMQYKPNNYQLYDMAGNVWEWTSDLFHEEYYKSLPKLCKNPKGAKTSYDPTEPLAVSRVTKGGSFLCHVSYCYNYRPSSREGTEEKSSAAHIGFRCVRDK